MEQILSMVRPEVIAAMVLCPVVLQYVRGAWPSFVALHAALVNFVIVEGVALWALRALWLKPSPEGLAMTATQLVLAWVLSDWWFRSAVRPLASSANPLMPEGGK